MSKHELQQRAAAASGVSYEHSLQASQLQPSLFDRVGGEEGFRLLSSLFYDRVFAANPVDTDDADCKYTPSQQKKQRQLPLPKMDVNDSLRFRNIFASSTKHEAIDNQFRFLVQTFGGPRLYQQKKKSQYTRLVGRHANYSIGTKAADQWASYMTYAMLQHPALSLDHEAREALEKYFKYTAHYIVVASKYMRPDQVNQQLFLSFILFAYVPCQAINHSLTNPAVRAASDAMSM